MKQNIRRISGHENAGFQQIVQIATVDTTINFNCFVPVGADAVLSVLKNVDASEALGYFDDTTVYQNIQYFGNFGRIKLASGKAVLYLSNQ
jgi:dihydrodipicolinate synthase/N-acetylneuraminate lyase